MAYECADRREVLYSDPLSLFKTGPGDVGVPTGELEMSPTGSQNANAADNARTIRETKKLVANHRVNR
jgi:hypothetical protein